jgi:hypothetical protein
MISWATEGSAMARTSASRRRYSESEIGTWVLGIAFFVLALCALGALLYIRMTTDRPVLDKTTLCPTEGGARSVTVVLLDTSDQWPEITREEVRKRLEKLAGDVPDYGLLELRLLDPAISGGRIIFSKCNPGNGANLDEITGNRRLARKLWLEHFVTPMEQALDQTLAQSGAKSSPILSTAQRIAVDYFDGQRPAHLIFVSDMIEFTEDYSQYKGDLSYERYKQSAAYRKQHTDLNGADVTILYVQRLRAEDSGAHIQFWKDWIDDNKGVVREMTKLQGAG